MTTTPDFDRLYADDPDPWQVATSWYERRKIDVVLASLRRPRYAFAWDAGCGTGDLGAALLSRLGTMLLTDASAEAVALAGTTLDDRRSAEHSVVLDRSALPECPTLLDGRSGAPVPDLVVLSEVLYYLTPDERETTYALVDRVAAPEADLVIVHWIPRADDARCSGLTAFNEASERLGARGWGRLVTHTDAEFVLGLFSRDVPGAVGGRDDADGHAVHAARDDREHTTDPTDPTEIDDRHEPRSGG